MKLKFPTKRTLLLVMGKSWMDSPDETSISFSVRFSSNAFYLSNSIGKLIHSRMICNHLNSGIKIRTLKLDL